MLDKWVEHIMEELEGACHYAKRYIHFKPVKSQWASMYHEMAEAELQHAKFLMGMAREYKDSLSWLSEADKTCFEHCEGEYAEKTALVKLMLQS